MRFSPILIVLGYLLLAGAQLCSAAGRAQTVPTPARAALEQMSPAERENSCVSVEFESSDSEAVALGREVERFWNGGQYDEALAEIDDLEARVGHVAIGNSWRKPVPTVETALWGRDVRIGNRDSLLELSLDAHPSSGNLFVTLRHGVPPHFSVCMSTDTGATWAETFTWSGSPPTSLDAAVLSNHLYVVYNSPGENAQLVRLRRFLFGNGKADTFRNGGSWVAACTLDAGDTMREVSLVSNQNDYRLYVVTLVSDGSVLVSVDDANAVSWTRQPTGITSGAHCGLDATADKWSDRTIFFSYCDTSDTVRVYDGDGQQLAEPAGMGTLTSISAYLDTVVCVYEDKTTSPTMVRCAGSLDGGDTWTVSTLSDSSIAADAPAVTVSGGDLAAVYRSSTSATELLFCQRTDSGPWSDPVSIAENDPSNSRPGIICLGAGVHGVAYLSDTSPVVRAAYFDRSDWVYGIAEQRRLVAEEGVLSVTPNPLRGHGWLTYALDHPAYVRVRMYDRAGSFVRSFFAGRCCEGRHKLSLDVAGVAPGVYFVRADADSRALTAPMTVAR
jgi:hypothetical protein